MTIKRFSVGFLFSAVLLGGIAAPSPAHAAFGVGDTVFVVGDIPRLTKDWGLDVASWFGGNAMIQSMSTSFLNQLLMGSSGGSVPPIIANMQDALLQTGDAQVQLAVSQLSDWAITSPYGTSLLNVAQQNAFRLTGPKAFEEENKFTLGEFTDNTDACLSGDFVTAGLPCLLGLSQGNTPLRTELAIEEHLKQQRGEAQKALNETVDKGQGFLGNLDCPQGNTINVGGIVNLSGGLPSLLNCTTQTTGFTVASLVNEVLPAGLRRMIQADEISETLASLAGQMLAQTLTGGGLFGFDQPSSGGGRSYLQQTTDAVQQQGNATVGGSLLTVLARQRDGVEDYQTAWQKIYTAAVDARSRLASCGRTNAQVTATIAEAEAALSRAQTALTNLGVLESAAEEAVSSGGGTQQTSISGLYTELAPTIPGPEEVQDAVEQSSEDPLTGPSSTYLEMQAIANNGCFLNI